MRFRYGARSSQKAAGFDDTVEAFTRYLNKALRSAGLPVLS